ncbi:hypothetical protein ADUPG1_007221, partial [Aduncisulcus paluster]
KRRREEEEKERQKKEEGRRREEEQERERMRIEEMKRKEQEREEEDEEVYLHQEQHIETEGKGSCDHDQQIDIESLSDYDSSPDVVSSQKKESRLKIEQQQLEPHIEKQREGEREEEGIIDVVGSNPPIISPTLSGQQKSTKTSHSKSSSLSLKPDHDSILKHRKHVISQKLSKFRASHFIRFPSNDELFSFVSPVFPSFSSSLLVCFLFKYTFTIAIKKYKRIQTLLKFFEQKERERREREREREIYYSFPENNPLKPTISSPCSSCSTSTFLESYFQPKQQRNEKNNSMISLKKTLFDFLGQCCEYSFSILDTDTLQTNLEKQIDQFLLPLADKKEESQGFSCHDMLAISLNRDILSLFLDFSQGDMDELEKAYRMNVLKIAQNIVYFACGNDAIPFLPQNNSSSSSSRSEIIESKYFHTKTRKSRYSEKQIYSCVFCVVKLLLDQSTFSFSSPLMFMMFSTFWGSISGGLMMLSRRIRPKLENGYSLIDFPMSTEEVIGITETIESICHGGFKYHDVHTEHVEDEGIWIVE